MAFDTILFDKHDGIATVTLNRPERLNAMTWHMIEEFVDAIEDCRQDDAVRVLVFTGAGRAFSSGDDIVSGMGERTRGGNPGGVNADRGLHHQLVKTLLELPKPVVAALNGRCHGAGFVLSLACDFRVGHAETLVGDIRSARAIFAGQSVPLLLPRLIGQSRAMDLLMTGRVIDAAEAERIEQLPDDPQTVVVLTDLAKIRLGNRGHLPALVQEADDDGRLLQRLNDGVEQHTIEARVLKPNTLALVLDERVHGGPPDGWLLTLPS